MNFIKQFDKHYKTMKLYCPHKEGTNYLTRWIVRSNKGFKWKVCPALETFLYIGAHMFRSESDIETFVLANKKSSSSIIISWYLWNPIWKRHWARKYVHSFFLCWLKKHDLSLFLWFQQRKTVQPCRSSRVLKMLKRS